MAVREALYILGDVVHQLQCERGSSALFLGSEGRLFRNRLEEQFSTTDTALKSLREGRERWKQYKIIKEAQNNKIGRILEKWSALSDKRSETINQAITPSHAIDFFSHQLISPLIQIIVEVALHQPGSDPAKVSAWNAFIQWKERVGLERALGVRGFIGYSFHNQEFLERVLFLLSEQVNHLHTFEALADAQQRLIVQQVLEVPAVKELEGIHAALRDTPEAEILHSLTPEAWFDLVSEKVDALHEAEKKLAQTLEAAETDAQKTDVTAAQPPASLQEYDDLLRSLQLFSGLSEDNRHALLRHGQVRPFQKGKLLFLEGEQANRLYIILKGWIKIFKGTAAGEETILQMLSSGDSILESAVFLNTPFPVSAQVAEDALLLSLPAPMIREQLRENNELALNLLASMSYRSQHLIRQIENARLKSVDERIGWYLLKLLLEQGRISRCIELPYDKSLIASYLDMKRETFSRALGRLKDKGFLIENDTIVAPELASLCGYCDTATAAECKLHGTKDCPNPQHEMQDENAA